jgi:hypothetical protein
MKSAPPKTRSSGRQPKPTWKKRENDTFIPLVIEPLPVDLAPLLTDPIPHFEPAMRVLFECMRSKLSSDDPLSLFIAIFGEESLKLIVDATNAKAKSFTPELPSPRPRPWIPLSRNELIVYLGTLIYMGRHYEFNQEYYWNPDKHRTLSASMSKTRWEQITRFLSIYINNNNKNNNTSSGSWFEKLDPLITIIRNRIVSAVSPATWVAVDEMMVAFEGRSSHTVKMKNKPIQEGFKIWVLGFNGYVYSFRFHSGVDGSEDMPRKARVERVSPQEPVWLAPQFQVPVVLCSDIRKSEAERPFLCFLDNLFLNVDVAHCLLNINVAVMGTTRKNATGIPSELLEVKNADKTDHKQLLWNSTIARIVGECLVFLWQDNNAVIAITTAHSLHRPEDQVVRLRRRPKASSSAAKITLPVFGTGKDNATKWLRIPRPIDDYNHGMNGVDLASQYRGGFSCHRPNSRRWWMPVFFWLLDICLNNAFLIWKLSQPRHRHRDKSLHKDFIDKLIYDMLHYNQWTPAPGKACTHTVKRLQKPLRCVYGYKHDGGCVQGQRGGRAFGKEISGNARRISRPRQTRAACEQCDVALCIRGGCWQRYHSEINR